MADNVELLRNTYEAFGRGDIPAVLGVFAEDIEWSVPEVIPHGGKARGREEVGGFFERLGSTWEDFGIEIDALFGSDDRVCASAAPPASSTVSDGLRLRARVDRRGRIVQALRRVRRSRSGAPGPLSRRAQPATAASTARSSSAAL